MAITSVTQTPSKEGLTDIAGLLDRLTKQYETTRAERGERYGAGLQTLQRMTDIMAGPEFGKYATELYESAKRKGVGAGVSRLISSGMAGTTRMLEPERGFEREVGTPFRLGLAEQRAGRIASAMGRTAEYMKTFPDIYPEPGTLAYLATGGFGQLTPEQKMASQEFPYLMRAAQAGGAGGTPTGGGAIAGGSSLLRKGMITPGGTTGGAAPAPTDERGGGWTRPDIQMAGGFGPAFQTPEEMAQVTAAAIPTLEQYVSERGGSFEGRI